MAERKKMSDIKKTAAVRTSIPAVVSRDLQKKQAFIVEKEKQLQKTVMRQTANTLESSQQKTFSGWVLIKRIFFMVLIVSVIYIVSLLTYHGSIHVTLKSQTENISDTFTAVPKDSFIGGEKKIPYYTYISDISISNSTQLLSSELFTRIQSALPPDAIVTTEFLFITQSQTGGQVIGIIFFKKQDIQDYIRGYVLTRDYKSTLRSLKNLTVTSSLPVTSSVITSSIPVQIRADIFGTGDRELSDLPDLVIGKDTYTCREILQNIREINIDKCTVFPFWYKKMPQNPKFIRIITK